MTARGFCLALLAAACGPTPINNPSIGGHSDASVPFPPPGLSVDAGAVQPAPNVVYAHGPDTLFLVDPGTLEVTPVARFTWPFAPDKMTDIAIDRNGDMIGISFDTVYAVDKSTATCRRLAPLDRQFNGLSFVHTDGAEQETLLATALDGSVHRLDPETGASTLIGNFGSGYRSSGDMVSVAGFGTVATVKSDFSETDWLVNIDPTTGTATPIGDTGQKNIWGLGFWGNQVYGFTSEHEFVLVDVRSGAASLVSTGEVAWWGAGVTTSAPVIE